MNPLRRSGGAFLIFATSLVLAVSAAVSPAAAAIPTDVSGLAVTPVLTGMPGVPVIARFAPDGRIYVGLKEGRVLMYDGPGDTTPVTTLDIRGVVQDFADRGMLGLVLDPAFATGRPFLYVLYSYDRDPFGDTAVPRWGDGCSSPPGGTTDGCTVSARVERFTINSSGVATGGGTLLLDGADGATGGWCDQFDSHAIGTIAFGADGMLYVGAGDGASYLYADYGQAGGSPGSPTPANSCNDKQGTTPRTGGRGTALTATTSRGGALRSQAVRGALSNEYVSWDGSILRIDPNSGQAAAGNPLVGNGIAGDDRIVAYGLRNPFRFSVQPGTNQVLLGDVGFNNFEELDTFASGPSQTTVPNFGWPCYEGTDRTGPYDSLDTSLCESLYSGNGTSSLGGVSSPLVYPLYKWTRAGQPGSLPCGTAANGGGGAVTGGTFVDNPDWPAALRGGYVFGDYARKCIAMIPMVGGQLDVAHVQSLVSGVFPVDFEVGPDGDIYWVDIATNTLNRLRSTAGNIAPVASFTATPPYGSTPLLVQFNASATTDPNEGEVLTYTWDLDGNGACNDANGITASRTYTSPATIDTKLCVTDQLGATSSVIRRIQPGNTPPVINSLTSSADATGWKVGDAITYSANVTDNGGALPNSAYAWGLTLRHCETETGTECHTHFVQSLPSSPGGAFVAPDHEYYAFLQLTLTVTDSQGLAATQTIDIRPRVSTITVQTTPAGITVATGQAAGPSPLSTKFLEGGAAQLVAPATATVGGTNYTFAGWVDSSSASATRTVTTPAGNTTYTARYDGQAPTATSVVAAPSNLDLLNASTITVTAALADDIGVASAGATITGPGGTTYQAAMSRTSGSTTSGSWSAAINVPTNAPLGSYTPSVVATDVVGKTATASGNAVTVSKSAAPAAPVITSLTTSADGSGWKVGDTIDYHATATDAQGTLPNSAYTWALKVLHCDVPGGSNCHEHALTSPASGPNGSFSAPDHADYPVLVLTLTVTDGDGMTATQSITIAPRISNVTVSSQVTGINVTAGSTTAPTTATARVVENGSVTISVPTTATVSGTTYTLIGWTDGSTTATRTFAAAAGNSSFTARYDGQAPGVTAVSASPGSLDLRLASTVTVTANLTDNVGVTGATAKLTGPGGATYQAAMTRTSGSATSGSWSATITVASDAPLGAYTPSVTATDGVALSGTGSGSNITVSKSIAPAAPVITSLTTSADANGWKVGDTIDFHATATDAQGTLPNSAYTWALKVRHCDVPGGSNCHDHPLTSPATGPNGSFSAPDHADYPVLVLTLTVTDGDGMTATQSITVAPRISLVTVSSQVAGINVTVSSTTAPTTATARVVENGSVTISVPTTATVSGTTYTFIGWTDGATTASRTFAAAAGNSSFTARYDGQPPAASAVTATPSVIDLRLSSTVTVTANLTDNIGVTGATAKLTGPGGTTYQAAMTRTTGTPTSGSWSATIAVAADAPLGSYTSSVVATDAVGLSGTSSGNTVAVSKSPAPAAPVITSLTTSADANGWKVGDTIDFHATATDEQGTLPNSAYTWALKVRHCDVPGGSNCHDHPLTAPASGPNGSFSAPDHADYPVLVLTLTVTDNDGTSTSQSVVVTPRISNVTVSSQVSGINVTVSSTTAPTTATARVVENGSVTISVPTTATVGGTTYTFIGWTDGATTATRTFAAAAGNSSFTARYDGQAPGISAVNTTPTSLDLRLASTVTVTANITDNVGVTGATAKLTGPGGTTYQAAMTRTSGSVTSGSWSATITVAADAPLGAYASSVAATDGVGLTGNGAGNTIAVSKSAAPIITGLTTSADANGWKVGDSITFQATATDNQGTLPNSAYTWGLKIRHCDVPGGSNCHDHALTAPANGPSGSFTAPDHADYPVLVLTLTVTDNEGLSATRSVTVAPRISLVTVQSSYPGINVTVSSTTAPTTATARVIENGNVTLSVPTTAIVTGKTYTFIRWSDGVTTATRTLAAPAGTPSYTALFDGQPPTVSGVSAPDTVDLRSDHTVTVTANAADDVALASATAKVTGPGGVVYQGASVTRPAGGPAPDAWTPSITITIPGNAPIGDFTPSVTVTDTLGKTATAIGPVIHFARTAPVITSLTTSVAAGGWKVGDIITFQAVVTDNQPSFDNADYVWTLSARTCQPPSGPCVDQPLPAPTATGPSGSFVTPDVPGDAVLALTLVVTDDENLTDTQTVLLAPRTSTVTVRSQTAGIHVTVGSFTAATEVTHAFVENGTVSLSVPATEFVGGTKYAFVGWTDNATAGRQRTLVVPTADVTFTAQYVLVPPPDTQPPVIASSETSPDRVDPQHDPILTVTASITDDTGVAGATARATAPNGTDYSSPMTFTGTGWATTITLPSNAPLGQYLVSISASDAAGNTSSAISGPVLVATVESLPPSLPAGLLAITPRRVLDTRVGLGAPIAPIVPGQILRLQVTGQPGIPVGATGIVVNVTAVDPAGPGYVTVFPCGEPPLVSNLNVRRGETVANLATVDLDDRGGVCFIASQPSDLVADVTAVAVDNGARYTGISPVRVADSRDGTGLPAGTITAGTIVEIPLAAATVPAGTTGVVANLTVTEPRSAGYLTAFPCDAGPPTASNVNFVSGQTVSNLSVTALDGSGRLCVVSNATLHLVVDVSGWLTPTGQSATFVAPYRVLDTRTTTRLTVGQTIQLTAAALSAPDAASAIIANITVVDAAAAGYVTVAPCESGIVLASNDNFAAAETRPVLTITTLGPSRTLCIHTSQPIDLVVDLQGWMSAG